MSLHDAPGTRPKLLFISPTFPLPTDRGQRVRVFNLVLACCRDFDVTLVSPPPDAGVDVGELKRLGVDMLHTGAEGRGSSTRELIRFSAAAREIVTRGRMAHIAPYKAVLDRLQLGDYDLVFVERGHLSVLAAGFYDRTIVDLDDLEHVRLFREMTSGMRFVQAARSLPRLIRLLARESWGLRRFRAALVCSETDRRRLKALGARKVIVVPNGADIPAEDALDPAPSKDAVFVGNCQYPPNADAVDLLKTTIIPDLRRSHAGFMVDVIGPHSEACDAPQEGLHGRGFVTDLYRELSRYKVLVAPLRMGGGTKLKVIDAMAAGVPVVTTPVGAEGLDLVHGENALIADDPHVLADHVRSILDEPGLGKRLAVNARAHVERNFSWERVRSDIADTLKAEAAAR